MSAFVHPALGIAAEVDWLGAQAGKPTPKPRGTPERDLQVEQVAWLRAVLPAGSVVAAIKNEYRADAASGRARARFYAKRREEGVQDGMPDIVIALPNAAVAWVENKSPRGVLSDAQRDMHAALRALGHTVIVARTIEQTRAGLIAAGVALDGGGMSGFPASNEGAKTDTPRPHTVPARIGGSPFPLPADKLPPGFRP